MHSPEKAGCEGFTRKKVVRLQSLLYSAGPLLGSKLLAFFPLRGPIMDLIYFSEHKKCPRCGSPRVHKSRRRGVVEKMAYAVLQIGPYRCAECDHRYFGWRFSDHTNVHRAA